MRTTTLALGMSLVLSGWLAGGCTRSTPQSPSPSLGVAAPAPTASLLVSLPPSPGVQDPTLASSSPSPEQPANAPTPTPSPVTSSAISSTSSSSPQAARTTPKPAPDSTRQPTRASAKAGSEQPKGKLLATVASVTTDTVWADPVGETTLQPGDAVELWRGRQSCATGRVTLVGNQLALGLAHGYAASGDKVYLARHPDEIATVTYPNWKESVPSTVDMASTGGSGSSSMPTPRITVDDSIGFNACATYVRGKPEIHLGTPLVQAYGAYSYLTACGELVNAPDAVGRSILLSLASAGNPSAFPPPPYVPPYLQDQVNARARQLFSMIITYVIGHEGAHFYLGHVSAAYSELGLDLDDDVVRDIHRLARLYQSREKEIAADTLAATYCVQTFGSVGANAVQHACIFMSLREKWLPSPDEYLCSHPYWSTRLAWMNTILAGL